jgi:hypothetical protein
MCLFWFRGLVFAGHRFQVSRLWRKPRTWRQTDPKNYLRLMKPKTIAWTMTAIALLQFEAGNLRAQKAQDNWYFWQNWPLAGQNSATTGGLSSPYGVAIGPDGRVYVGDQGYELIQVYLTGGAYSFSIWRRSEL